MVGSFTIARAMGFAWSRWAYGFLLLAPFLCVAALVLGGLVGRSALVAWLALPLALWSFRALVKVSGPLDPLCYELRRNAACLHLAFGLPYSLSFLFY
jgi:1,4-dihydroxy-2-naphthoate octaprenyltransferase